MEVAARGENQVGSHRAGGRDSAAGFVSKLGMVIWSRNSGCSGYPLRRFQFSTWHTREQGERHDRVQHVNDW
jgi:hypothetical protein